MKATKSLCSILSLFALALCLVVPSQLFADEHETVQWINHLDFLAGDAEITTVYNSALSGLEVTAAATGENFIVQGVQASPGFLVTGVRVCYELSSSGSFIDQIAITQLQNPPVTSTVVLSDATDQTDMGPVCVNSAPPFGDSIDPGMGALSLGLGVDFDDTDDNIVVLGVGLLTIPDPDSPMLLAIQELQEDLAEVESDLAEVESDLAEVQDGLHDVEEDLEDVKDDMEDVKDDLENHTHYYLTGKGVGHNKVMVSTGSSRFSSETPQQLPVAYKKNKKK